MGRVTGQSSTNGVRMARQERSSCSRSPSTNGTIRRTGLPTGVTSSIRSRRRRDWICGRLPLSGERAPFDVARTSFAESAPGSRQTAAGSPTNRMRQDGSRFTFSPFPGPGPKVQVSAGGGRLARWRRDGGELFYLAPDRRLMAVSVAESGVASRDGSSARLVHAVDDVGLRALTRRSSGFWSPPSSRRPAPSPSSSTGNLRQDELGREHLD